MTSAKTYDPSPVNDTAASPTQETAQVSSPVPVRPRWTRYLLWIICPALLRYVLPLFLIRIPAFERWCGTTYGPSLDFAFRTAGKNADVVIFGDSSALHGVNPALMSTQLGVKVLNLPNTAGSLPVTADLALQRYLQANRPPRLIVLYFAPWDFNYRSHESSEIFEGEEMLARNGTLSELAAFARNHPVAALQFPIQLYAVAPKPSISALLHHKNRTAAVEASSGYMDAQALTNLSAPCELPDRLFTDPAFNSVQALAARYHSPETRILIFVAPIPSCTNDSPLLTRDYSTLPAAPPRKMAPDQFRNDRNFVHLDPAAVPQSTQVLSAAVRAALQ